MLSIVHLQEKESKYIEQEEKIITSKLASTEKIDREIQRTYNSLDDR
jgi:hypothetical protein